MKNETVTKSHSKHLSLSFLVIIPISLLVFLSILAFYSAKWYANTYGQLGFDSILYTLFSDLGGVESDLVFRYLLSSFLPAILWSVPLCLVLFISPSKKFVLNIFSDTKIQLFPFRRIVSVLLSLLLSVVLLNHAAKDVQLWEYLEYALSDTTLYEDYYRDPAEVNITFPEQKRNLIYIFLESMETTYFSTEDGGLSNRSIIPELCDLAKNNVYFSNTSSIGGIHSPVGSTWTIGAMVAQSAGIPLKPPPGVEKNSYGADNVFLPGVTSITNILRDNGYYQTLMVGSGASFGGRSVYYESHGIDRIYDVFTAREEGFIPKDYYVWWGFEDLHLFAYAKQVLAEISSKTQPFAFTMLTADTHPVGGYLCSNCQNTSSHPYENVLACSSQQVSEFVKWIQEQDFYENTTIIIVGDHPLMDNEYITSLGAQDSDRQIYNCFINSVAEASATTNRIAFSTDMFPTTLAAMGCTIEGNRLGLGTNLFSDTPTLAEMMGPTELNNEMGKKSSYYSTNFYFTK